MDNASLKRAFGSALRDAGFERKGASWHFSGPDATAVVNLQKDDVSAMWFVNIGVWIRALGDETWPASHHCHLQARVEDLWPARREEILDMFDLDRGLPSDTAWASALGAFAEDDVAPACKRLVTRDGILEAIGPDGPRGFRIMLTAYPWLGLAPPG